jgi:hypothetical protein
LAPVEFGAKAEVVFLTFSLFCPLAAFFGGIEAGGFSSILAGLSLWRLSGSIG